MAATKKSVLCVALMYSCFLMHHACDHGIYFPPAFSQTLS